MELVGLRHLPRVFQRALILIAIALAFAVTLAMLPAQALGQSLDKPTFVVALDKLDGDRMYSRAVMIAAPLGGGHVGVILNKPTLNTMARFYPGDAASALVTDPIYAGGHRYTQAVVAVTRASSSPGENSVELLPGVWLVIHNDVIDSLMAADANAQRYYMGFVTWAPGELEEEVRKGLMMLAPADPAKMFLADTGKLYDELVTPNRKPRIGT